MCSSSDDEQYEDETDNDLKSDSESSFTQPPRTKKRNVSLQRDDSRGNTSSTSSSSGRIKKFCPAWRNKYKWLCYNTKTNLMYCELCRNEKMKNPYLHGTSNFNYTNLARQSKSADHKRMVIASITQPITTVVAHATTKAEAALTAASRNVYWLAKEEIATYKYSSLNYLTLMMFLENEATSIHDPLAKGILQEVRKF